MYSPTITNTFSNADWTEFRKQEELWETDLKNLSPKAQEIYRQALTEQISDIPKVRGFDSCSSEEEIQACRRQFIRMVRDRAAVAFSKWEGYDPRTIKPERVEQIHFDYPTPTASSSSFVDPKTVEKVVDRFDRPKETIEIRGSGNVIVNGSGLDVKHRRERRIDQSEELTVTGNGHIVTKGSNNIVNGKHYEGNYDSRNP